MVITMASYALQRHLGWCMQSRLGQKADFWRFSAFDGQRSVTAAWATPSPWSIMFA